ncbi:MAG: YigZ family protein [Clostridia bacterium]|nr:YigZ family protein [Clostridia bacterium]
MLEKYMSVAGETHTEKIIEKSKFITTSRHVESEDEAKGFIAEISKRYSDATHNCYAYISDKLSNFLRFSDDGEPQGTAGMPILEVIKSKRLAEVAVIVTRYFGGIKLGAGGLLRAYSGCAAENLDSAQKVLYETCSEIKIVIEYSLVDTALRYFGEACADILNTEYLNEVIFTVAVKKAEEEGFISALINRLNGKVKTEKLREYFFPFKI